MPNPAGDRPHLLDAPGAAARVDHRATATRGDSSRRDDATTRRSPCRPTSPTGDFTYSEDAPVEEGYDGSGIGHHRDVPGGEVRLLRALRVGDGAHVASLGIPSRIAVGFQPGRASTLDNGQSRPTRSAPTTCTPGPSCTSTASAGSASSRRRVAASIPDYSTPAAVDDPLTPENEALPTPVADFDGDAGCAPGAPGSGRGGSGSRGIVGQCHEPAPDRAPLAARDPARGRIRAQRHPRGDSRHGGCERIRSGRRIRRRPPGPSCGIPPATTAGRLPTSETPRDFADRLAVVMTSDRERIVGLRSDVEESAFAPPGRGVPSVDELARSAQGDLQDGGPARSPAGAASCRRRCWRGSGGIRRARPYCSAPPPASACRSAGCRSTAPRLRRPRAPASG